MEKNELSTQIFSEENKYYKYLNNSTNKSFKKFFKILI